MTHATETWPMAREKKCYFACRLTVGINRDEKSRGRKKTIENLPQPHLTLTRLDSRFHFDGFLQILWTLNETKDVFMFGKQTRNIKQKTAYWCRIQSLAQQSLS